MIFDVKIRGLKCDNPNCDYVNKNVDLENYEKYINSSCPKCGANLLTVEDYKNVETILKFQKLLSKIPYEKDGPQEKYNVKMNGTGQVEFQKVEDNTKEKQKHI